MMNNKISIPNIIPNRYQCKNCTHKYMRYDERFSVNGEHYYCNVEQVMYDLDGENEWIVCSEGECIDCYWWDDGECPYYKVKEKSQ